MALEDSFRFRAGLLLNLSRDLPHSLGPAAIKSLWPLLFGQQSQKGFPLDSKTTGILTGSEVPPASSKERTRSRKPWSSNHVCGFCSSVGTQPFRYPPLGASLLGLGSPDEDKSPSHSNPSSPKTSHSGNLCVYKP